MKIGLVSADKHCKSHITALLKDGYNVTCLGARPNSIPPSYDALIVRVASISHGGEATARAWVKQTGKPAIYEDGLTGIRRELSALQEIGESVEEASPPDIFSKLLGCAESYHEARPEDGPDEMAEAIRGVIAAEHPDLSERLRRSMVSSITPRFFSTTSFATPTPAPEKTMPNVSNIPPYVGSPALWPTDTGWAEKYTEPKVRAAYREAVSIITLSGVSPHSPFASDLMSGAFDPKAKAKWKKLLQGKPLPAAFVLYMLAPNMTKKQGNLAYNLITGKGIDGRLKDVVSWAVGSSGGGPVDPVVHVDPVVDTSGGGSTIVADNTNAILEIMDDLSTLRAECEGWEDRIKGIDLAAFKKDIDASIKAKIKVLDDSQREVFKALQTFGSESGVEHSANEYRIRGLERCWDDLQGQVPTLVGQAADAVEHRLREDISNAFDALAAEQQPQTPDLSSNPFAALEQVKAALKAAGFKGTLTLTIE